MPATSRCLHGTPFVIIARIATYRRETIGRKGEKALDRSTPRHILDVGVQAAVFVNDQHGRKRTRASRLHQIPTQGA